MEQQQVNATTTEEGQAKPLVETDSATVRFCGDSGDGMQLAGTQLTNTSALAGNDVATFPDFPAEIRAPRGTKAGVSGFQIHFASHKIFTPGDQVDALVAMNPAALVTNLQDLRPGGILIVNSDAFGKRDLDQAGYKTNPLEDGTVRGYQLFQVDMTRLTRLAVKEVGLSTKEADRCGNFFAMGLVYWLYDRPLEPTERFITEKFGRRPDIAEANRRALHAGYNYGETTEAFRSHYHVDPAQLPPGTYRNITGNQALAWGAMAAAKLSGCELFYGTLPHHAGQRHPARAFAAEELRRAHLPGRGRDRRADGRDRRRLRRLDGRDRHQRPGHVAEVRSHRPGRDDRAAAVDHQRAAGRAEHRPADQDRAGRPATRRCSAATANAPCRSSLPAVRPTASTWPSRPGDWPPAT